jgi:hypothetical protein
MAEVAMNRAWLMVPAALILGGGIATAEPKDRPTLSVLTFTAGGGLLSPPETAELADDLASRLVETGRFRVLPREWLAGEPAASSDLTALREAARHAGVRYLVSASVTNLNERPSPAPRALGAARAILALRAPRGRAPIPCGSPRARPSLALVEARVIDAGTGAVVRTSVLRVRLGMSPAAAGCGGGAVAPIASLIASRSRPELDGLKSANQNIASSLVLPGDQRHSVTQ